MRADTVFVIGLCALFVGIIIWAEWRSGRKNRRKAFSTEQQPQNGSKTSQGPTGHHDD